MADVLRTGGFPAILPGPTVIGMAASQGRPRPSFLDLVLVDRHVYWRVLSLDYQVEQFEVFHRSRVTRWTHYVGTQVIVGAFLLACAGRSVGPVPAMLLLAVGLVAWYLALDVVTGAVAGVQVGVLSGLALLLSGAGAGLREAVWALVVAAAAQNVSHAVEPVPPVLTGRGFEPFAVFWARATTRERVRVIALNVFYLPLELVSAPRLFPVHVLQALYRAGWRRDQAEDVRARASAILAAAA